MEQWFDTLTKGVAQSPSPRRTFLKSLFAAAATSVVRAPFTWETAVPEAAVADDNRGGAVPEATLAQANGSCTARTVNGQSVLQFSVQDTFTGLPLVLSGSVTVSREGAFPPKQPVALSAEMSQTVTAVTLGRLLLARMTTTATALPGKTAKAQTTIVYSAPIQGVRNAQFTVNGSELTGAIDNRTIVPQKVPSSEPLRMTDNGPVPKIAIDPALAEAIRALGTAAEQRIRTCQRIATRVARPNTRASQVLTSPVSVNAIELSPPFGLAEGGFTSPACTNCLETCNQTVSVCWGGSFITCLFDLGISCGVGPGVCAATGVICTDNCDKVGGACCKTACPQCCDDDAVCCGTSCCYTNTAASKTAGVCSNGDCCLPTSPVGCGGYCCKSGQSCCGKFDPFGSGGIAACCPAGQFCVDAKSSLCCPSANMVNCGDTCCSSSSNCINNGTVCCDGGIICGNECCRNGESCLNGHCGFGPCGNTFCGFATCCNGVCCDFNQLCVNGVCQTTPCGFQEVPCPNTPGQCCPPGLECCLNNTCCDPGTQCCGVRGCVPIGTCVS
jgi:hypothetical protein